MRSGLRSSLSLLAAALSGAVLCAACSATMDRALDGGGADGARAPGPTPAQAFDSGTSRAAYPIVLAHGLDGFRNIGPLHYYFGVADALKKDGHDVWVAQVDAYNSSETRGAELQAFVLDVLAKTGAGKVDLICHSQGGLDCRYVASNLGAQVAAVVTISAPHHADPAADVA